jgi:predicted nucleotidyltransferase
MKPSESLHAHLDQVLKTISRYPVRNPMLFGSAARGDDSEASDLDILVEIIDHATFFDLAYLELELESILGCKVDVVTRAGLARGIRDSVAFDLKPLG